MLSTCLALLENPQDESRFEEFYNKFYNIIFYIAKDYLKTKESSEDCAHEILIFFAKNFHNIPQDLNDKRLLNYIRVVSKGMAIDMYRKNKKHTEYVVDNDISEFYCIGEEDFEAFDRIEVQQAIEKIPEEYKQIFYLKYLCEYSGEEIAKMLNISKPLVRKRCMLGMQFVRSYLKGYENNDKV